MTRTALPTLVLGIALVGLSAAGCRSHRAGPPPAPPPLSPVLPTTPRGLAEPDVSAVPTEMTGPARRPAEYRRLTAPECRKYAVANAPFADDLDRHPDNQPPGHPLVRKRATQQAEAGRLIRGFAADDLRNRAAGDALEEFYKLANAEGQFDLLAAADTELRDQLEAALRAEKAGLKDRADITAIRRRLLDVEAQQAKLVAGADALNASLRVRLGLAGNDPLPIWPTDPLKVHPDDVDIEQAVATGLHFRPDLNLLRTLAAGSGEELAEDVMRSISPLLARAGPENPLVALIAPIFAPFTGTAAVRRAEVSARIQRVLAARERQAEGEIRAAALMLRGHRVAIAARILDVKQVEAKIAELQKKKQVGIEVTADLAVAKLDLLKARGDLLSAVIDWQIAQVKLRQAMGLLVRE